MSDSQDQQHQIPIKQNSALSTSLGNQSNAAFDETHDASQPQQLAGSQRSPQSRPINHGQSSTLPLNTLEHGGSTALNQSLQQSLVEDEAENNRRWYSPVVSSFGFVLEVLQILVIVVVLSFIIRSYVVQPFYIVGSSMEPTLYEQDILLIDRITYRFSDPHRGDVVVIHPPTDTRDFIKRVIGLPGEKVTINQDGQVLINDIILEEVYLSEENQTTRGALELTLNDDEYFLLGDNRQVSNDSRGSVNQLTNEAQEPWTISKEDIVGKALVRWWPLNEIDFTGRPEYNL